MSTRTVSERYGPAMAVTDQAEADRCFEQLVAETMEVGKPRGEAEAIERGNLGYYAGYYDHETRLRVERLFCCAHPVFGPAADHRPTPEECFAMGVEFGRKNKSKAAAELSQQTFSPASRLFDLS